MLMNMFVTFFSRQKLKTKKASRSERWQNLTLALLIVIALIGMSGCKDDTAALSEKAGKKTDQAKATDSKSENGNDQANDPGKANETLAELSEPMILFDGESLENWEEIEFGGEGDISTDDGVISFEMGDPMTGISSTREDLPPTNYEVSLDARKTQGVDFFCGLTFPVNESHCTLILGGWGGDTCGLSCINDQDASRNDTSCSVVFKQDQWYKIRVRVEPERIQAWVDADQIIDCNIAGFKVSLRGDTTLCDPLGICSFQTNAEYKNIELRTIKVAKQEDVEKAKAENK